MLKPKKNQIKGSLAAGFVALTQGAEGILFTLLGLVAIFSINDFSRDTTEFSAAVLGMKEILGVIISCLVFYKYVIPAFKKARTTKGKWFIISGVLTGIGNLFYILGIAFAGPSYGVILTALYPVFSMILMKMFFKDTQGWKVWFGVAVAVIGAVAFTLIKTFKDAGDFEIKTMLGMIFGLIAAFLWAIEGIFIKKGNDIKTKVTWPNREVVLIRTTSSALTTVVVLMPMSLAFNTSTMGTYEIFTNLWTHWEAMLIVLFIAINIVVLRVVHLYAIKTIGPKLTAIIDTNNFLIGPFFAIFLSMAPGALGALFEPIPWFSWLAIIPIIVGVYMVIYFEKTEPQDETIRREREV